MLAGSVSQMIGIVFDCTKDSLSMAYIGKGPFNAQAPVPVTIIVKVDGNEPVKFQGAFTKRNDEYIQAGTSQEGIVQVFEQLKQAKSKMLIDLHAQSVNKKMSVSADVV